MPKISVRDTLVKQLNLLNGQTLSGSDILLGAFNDDSDQPTHGTSNIKGAPAGQIANTGKTQVTYNRQDLATLAKYWPTPLAIYAAPTLYESLLRLAQVTGLHLTTDDVEDVAITYTNNLATINLVAKAGSNLVSGSVQLTLRARKNAVLGAKWPTVKLPRTTVLSNLSELARLANTVNKVFVDPMAVSHGDLSDSDSTLGNSAVTFSGIPAYGYTGDVTVYFDRDRISDLFPDLYMYSTTPYSGTTRQFVQTYFPQVLDKVALTDIIDEPITYGSTGKNVDVAVRIATTSLNVTGTLLLHVLWQSGTDVVSVRQLLTQYAVQEPTAAGTTGVFAKMLVPQLYPVSLRQVLIQYATLDITAAGTTGVVAKYLVPQLYGVSLRQVLVQYAVAES